MELCRLNLSATVMMNNKRKQMIIKPPNKNIELIARSYSIHYKSCRNNNRRLKPSLRIQFHSLIHKGSMNVIRSLAGKPEITESHHGPCYRMVTPAHPSKHTQNKTRKWPLSLSQRRKAEWWESGRLPPVNTKEKRPQRHRALLR